MRFCAVRPNDKVGLSSMRTKRAFAASSFGAVLAALTACGGGWSNAPPAAPLAQARSLSPERTRDSSGFNFMIVDDQADPSFNEILGINDGGRLVGYYGSGSASDPSEGYIVVAPYQQINFKKESYPGAADTELSGISD